ncbi:ead/Ea22-like family protein [Serratia marcescens]|uniref:ead/Ea22-like family protein n=1 Tax=Serratia marcescens TaxID=615 RepID=UPI001FD58633|nr:ead/Ea22-like family protein [Serratia marcescens]UOO26840.1 ead/Ea22-like family protein [Serratia marcescens]HBB9120179.1 ead/Ea22-like family protein [Serratia marcescens]
MDKLSELKAAALAATPGPWGINRTGNTIVSNQSHPVATVSDAFHRQLAGGGVGKDAEFIATANPAAVLELLADNEHLARELVARNGEIEWLRKRAADLEAKDKRIAELEDIATDYAGKFQKAQDALKYAAIMSDEDKRRIAELELIRADAYQVFKEIGTELGCNPDNESIMMAIDELKATQMTGPLKDVLKRNIELEAKLATPVRLPDVLFVKVSGSAVPVMHAERVKERVHAAGFTVEGDE